MVGHLWPEISIVAVWFNVGLFPTLWSILGKHWVATGLAHLFFVVGTHQETPLVRTK
jgi:hypothetical protein